MIAPAMVEEVRRLLAEGTLTHRKIAARTGVARGTVGRIASGPRPDYKTALRAADAAKRPAGLPRRCPGCGGKVLMPCQACRVRRAMVQTADGRPRGALWLQAWKWGKVSDIVLPELPPKEDEALFSPPVLQWTQLIRAVKTARAILNGTKKKSVRQMAQTIIDQLTALVPELACVGRSDEPKEGENHEPGMVAERRVPDSTRRLRDVVDSFRLEDERARYVQERTTNGE